MLLLFAIYFHAAAAYMLLAFIRHAYALLRHTRVCDIIRYYVTARAQRFVDYFMIRALLPYITEIAYASAIVTSACRFSPPSLITLC